MAGAEPRSDGFFDSDFVAGRSPAEELLEGALLQAADSYEERKVPLLGNLYAELAFAAEVDRPTANYLLLLARRLTYRQLVLMACLWKREAMPEALLRADSVSFDDAQSIEVDELERLGLVGRGDPGGTPKRGGATFVDAGSLDPRKLTLTAPGAVLYRLMDLGTIDPQSRQELYAALVVR